MEFIFFLIAFFCGLFAGSLLKVFSDSNFSGKFILHSASYSHDGKKLKSLCCGLGKMPFGRYLVPGIMTGIIFAAFMYRYGWPKMLWHAVYFLPLVIIFFIDLEHKIIPNSLVIALLALSIPKVCSNLDVKLVLGGLMAGGIFLLLALLSQGGLGGGDIKLAAALGLWFGWQEMLLLIFLAFLVGGLVAVLLLLLGVKSRKDAIPFAPFLVGAAFSVTMWGKEILQWYLQLSGLQFK